MINIDFCESLINDLCNISISDNLKSSLTQTLSAYNSGVNSTIVSVMRNSVFAIGASLLALFMLIELITLIDRGTENDINAFRLPITIMVKYCIFATLFCNIPTILDAIQEIAAGIASSMAATDYNLGVGITAAQVSSIADAIGELSFLNKIFMYVTLLIAWLIVKAISCILTVTTIFRMFELWIMLMFSPIPLAFISNRDLRQTAINFLKMYAAVCLQAAAIIGCFIIYQALISSGFISAYSAGSDITAYINNLLFNNIFYAVALCVAIMSSGRIVKQLLNVM